MSSTTLRRQLRSVFGACTLALCVLAVQSFAPAAAAVHSVANCNDAGTGSLRDAVAIAASGDTIDLAALACNRITLTSGQIDVPQDDLTLVGPGSLALTIDGNLQDRVFWHERHGTLRVQRLSIARGRSVARGPYGGCIYSAGDVRLYRARVHHCVADTPNPGASGGYGAGVYANRTVTLSYSSAFNNIAETLGGAIWAEEVVLDHSKLYENRALWGGGFYARSNATLDDSVVRSNRARGSGGGFLLECGGGPDFRCRLTIRGSTISANRAPREAAFYAGFTHRVLIRQSTITGNVANHTIARLPAIDRAYWSYVRIYNSTITSNHEQPQAGDTCAGAIALKGETLLESTIVAGNTCSLGDKDIGGDGNSYSVTGSHNIIGHSDVPIPDDTILATDPRLAPLAHNGGATPTRRPLADSPALDRGSNVLNLAYDQRGPGFPRVQGAFAEIGAIER